MDCKLSSQAISSALKADDCKVAEKLLEKMDSSFGPRGLLELLEYYFLKTRLAILRGEPRTASLHAEALLQSLRSALAIGNSRGFLNTFPDNPPLHLEKWPCALKIYTLGRFVVLKNGQPIRFSRKAQQKPLSMLKALIAFGGREVRKDQIADALWPEADGDMVEQSFATTLHRLRKVIGYRNAIELQHERVTLGCGLRDVHK